MDFLQLDFDSKGFMAVSGSEVQCRDRYRKALEFTNIQIFS